LLIAIDYYWFEMERELGWAMSIVIAAGFMFTYLVYLVFDSTTIEAVAEYNFKNDEH
jgi:hypothetical protein